MGIRKGTDSYVFVWILEAASSVPFQFSSFYLVLSSNEILSSVQASAQPAKGHY